MDITFKTNEGIINLRSCAVITNNGKVLAMHDGKSPYYYLPGGRIKLHERAEDAVLRELNEELGIDAKIVRPLWVNQSFFTEDVTKDKVHEICFYFLVDVGDTDLIGRGDVFETNESKHKNTFEWLPFEILKNEYLYPLFIKERIFDLPEVLQLNTEKE